MFANMTRIDESRHFLLRLAKLTILPGEAQNLLEIPKGPAPLAAGGIRRRRKNKIMKNIKIS